MNEVETLRRSVISLRDRLREQFAATDEDLATIEARLTKLDPVKMTIGELLPQITNERVRKLIQAKAATLGCPEGSTTWTVGPLLAVSGDEWLAMPKCGVKFLDEIRAVLNPLGAKV